MRNGKQLTRDGAPMRKNLMTLILIILFGLTSNEPCADENKKEKNLSGNLLYAAVPVVIVGYLIYRNYNRGAKAEDAVSKMIEDRQQEIIEQNKKEEHARTEKHEEWMREIAKLRSDSIEAEARNEEAVRLFISKNKTQLDALESIFKKIDDANENLVVFQAKCGMLGMVGDVKGLDRGAINIFGRAVPWPSIDDIADGRAISQSAYDMAEEIPGSIFEMRTLIVRGYSEAYKIGGAAAIGSIIVVGPFCYESKKQAINAFGGPTTAYVYGRCKCESKSKKMEKDIEFLEEEKNTGLMALGISEDLFARLIVTK